MLVGIEKLRKKLDIYTVGASEKFDYYAQKRQVPLPSLSVPSQWLLRFRAVLGWTTKAVDALADRLHFRYFSGDFLNLNRIFLENNPDIFFDSAIHAALVASCCFVYISQGADGGVRLQVLSARNATGEMDPITGLLSEGYAVLERDENGRPKVEAYFLPRLTIYYENGEEVGRIEHAAPAPLLVPIVFRPDSERPFGRSRISKAAIYFQQNAERALLRSDVAGEFYSFPQRYALGVEDVRDEDEEEAGEKSRLKEIQKNGFFMTVSSMLAFTKDSDGDTPKLGQFEPQSFLPFLEQLRAAAAGFAGETGLTLDDLGFVTDNPTSAEAIKAAHENLKIAARKAQKTFGSGFLNVGYLAACLRDNFGYERKRFAEMSPLWEPLFIPDADALGKIADGVYKMQQAMPGFFGVESLRELTGIRGESATKSHELSENLGQSFERWELEGAGVDDGED